MNRSTIELEIPEDVYEQARDIARCGNRSVESVLQDGLSILFGTSSEVEVSPDSLVDFSDEQLWEVVHRRLSWAKDSRLRTLMALGKEGRITEQERQELEHLVAVVDRQMLLRTKALVLMKQRGHDIETYLELGV